MDLQLSIALSENPRTFPIHEGKVKPDGITLTPTPLHPSEMFWRQLAFAEFDVSEMSMSSLMMITAGGDDRFVGLPVFTTRRFFHTEIMVRRDRGIEKPEDLKGKKLGVPEYQQTAALWTRGVLEHEWGVTSKDVEHWMERVPERSHRGAVGFTAPAGVTINQIPANSSIGEMMVSGELDGAIHYIQATNLVDRSTVDLHRHPDIKTLFPDPVAEGQRFYQKTGLYPINHGMVVRREIAEKHPWAVLNLFKAMVQANDIAERQRVQHVAYHIETGLVPQAYAQGLATPLITHGIKANREVLETAAQYSHEQGLTPRRVQLDEMFAPSVMDT